MPKRPPDAPDDFASTLKRARQGAGLSQADLGRRAGLTGSYVCMLELRRKPAPAADVVRKLAKALGVAPRELVRLSTLERTPDAVRRQVARLSKDRVRARRRRDRLLSTTVFHLARRPGFQADDAASALGLPTDYRPLFLRLANRLRKAPSERDAARAGRRVLRALPPRERDAMVEAIPRLIGGGGALPAPSVEPAPATPPERPWRRVPVRRSTDPAAAGVVDHLRLDRRLWRPGVYVWVADDDDAFPRVERGDWLLLDPQALPADGDLVAVRHEGRTRVRTLRRGSGEARLYAARPDLPPLHVPEASLSVAGVVRWVFRRL